MSQFKKSSVFRHAASDAPTTIEGWMPDADTGASPERADTQAAERCAWSVVWLGVMSGGLSAWGMWGTSPTLTVLALVLVLAAIAGIFFSWLSRTPRSRNFQLLALAAVVVSVAASQYGAIHTRHFYTTDSAAFDHVAAQTLLHGRDPYSSSMSAARKLLDVPDQYWTYTVTGGHVTGVSYPAGSFLLVAPAMLLGFRHQIVDWVDLVAWLVTGVLLFTLLPAALRWLAGLLILTPLFVGIFSFGGTDATFLPFLVLAVWRWDRFGGGRKAGVAGWIGPIALGLACAVKQSPWFCVPFLIVGVAMEARRAGRRPARIAARYAGTVLAVFTAVNLPFIVWHPSAWLHGSLTPFVEPLVADGQGLVSLATHGILRGVDLTDLTVCGVLVYLTVLAAFVVNYPRLKRVWLVLVPLSMFFSARSLSSYLVDFLPIALLGAFTVAGVRGERRPVTLDGPAKRWRPSLPVAVCVAPALAAAAAAILAFTNPPLELEVRHIDTAAGGTELTAITLSVRNLTGVPEVPHVLVTMGSHPAGFWLPHDGRMEPIPPHAEMTVTLYPPFVTYTASSGVQWLVAAYTANPRSLSTSELQTGRRP
jgi:uncharacterized membrane protein